MDTMEKKRQRECRTLEKMLRIYCRGQHRPASREGLCPDCRQLLAYARQRIAHCPCMAIPALQPSALISWIMRWGCLAASI